MSNKEVSTSYIAQLTQNGEKITLHYPSDDEYQYKQVTFSNKFYEQHYLYYMSFVVKLYNYKIFYDIGACFGNHTVYLHKRNKVKSFCFEPNPDSISFLMQNITCNNINAEVISTALGSSVGNAAIKTCNQNFGGSFIQEGEQTHSSDNVVSVTTLDIAIRDHSINPPDFIKIDTEGYEHNILKGAQDVLKNSSPDLFIEIFSENYPAIKNTLEQYGYQQISRIGKNYHFSKRVNTFGKMQLNTFVFILKLLKEIRKACSNFRT